ncbi:alkaline phosphatase [Pseudodesulfovibrio sp. JC047]|uniref:alkaline phosphatase n=1 Tax=Pseudodesulfovibrio sp. JC047 TaxID=2683199 RepID=UPI0013D6B4D5|nr:alkaline phosphatase [Pseudodesulfovibrio sp. JC047]NDV18926.1 alkaline phosphatase [Pseudodesulfovibrio sp. JC047]
MMDFGKKWMKGVCTLLLAMACVVGGGLAKAEAGEITAKYVFLFIGDGMGLPQRAATSAYTGKQLAIDAMPAQGITTTFAADRFITGSAASATALASGIKTNINYIGVDPDFKPVKTIAEMARDQGRKVGIVSSVSIDHATPAAFYAHVKTRKMYHEIDVALAQSGFDFFAGGGLKDPAGVKSKKPLGNALNMARENGYTIVNTKKDFMALKPGDGKVLAWNEWLQDGKALPYAMDMTDADITLAEFTGKAIEMLDNDDGFFLMVEGGKIDWACHANDATASILNTIAFDASVQQALAFYEKHPDETVIVVTGDHECGGLTLGFAGTKYGSHFDILSQQKVSFQKFTDEIFAEFKKTGGGFEAFKPVVTENFGLKFSGNPKKDALVLADFQQTEIRAAFERSMQGSEKLNASEYLMYGEYEPVSVAITHVLNQKAGLGWTSYKHTGVPVSTSAIGVRAAAFNGSYDNIDIATKLMKIMGLKPEAKYVDSGAVRLAVN